MSLRRTVAAYKEKANNRILDPIVGKAAGVVARSVVGQLETGDEARVDLRRRPLHDQVEGFLTQVGLATVELLQDTNPNLVFDPEASLEASKDTVRIGYGNPPVRLRSPDRLSFVFTAAQAAEIHQIQAVTAVEQLPVQAAA